MRPQVPDTLPVRLRYAWYRWCIRLQGIASRALRWRSGRFADPVPAMTYTLYRQRLWLARGESNR